MKRSLLFCSVLVLVPATAHAQASKADALYQEAVELFKAGNVAGACEKLDASFRLEAKTQTLFSLAKCREREGKIATASSQFTELVERAKKEGQKDKEAQMQARVTELAPRVPRVTLKLGRSDVSSVTLDGQPVAKPAWKDPILVDPGEHVFRITRTNKPDVDRKVTLKERDAITIDVDAPPKITLQPLITAEPPPDPSYHPPERETGHRTLGYILGGVGVAGIAAGSVFGVMAIGQKNDADDKFAARDPSFKDSDNSASTSALVSTILFGVGIAGLAAGAYFVLTSPSQSTLALVNRVERGALLW